MKYNFKIYHIGVIIGVIWALAIFAFSPSKDENNGESIVKPQMINLNDQDGQIKGLNEDLIKALRPAGDLDDNSALIDEDIVNAPIDEEVVNVPIDEDIVNTTQSEADTLLRKKMEDIQTMRRERVKKTCAEHPELHYDIGSMNNRDLYKFAQYMYADDNNKVIFCFIPKAASHSVRAILLNNTGKLNVSSKAALSPWKGGKLEDIGISRLGKNTTAKEVLKKVQTYYTFIFPRHPLDRLVSAYNDKFLGYEKPYANTFSLRIKSKLRPGPINETAWKTDRISFNEFTKYIVQNDSKIDWHWDTFQNLCHPCAINFDFIGSIETFDRDTKFLIKEKLASKGYTHIPQMHSKRKGDGLDAEKSGFIRKLEKYSEVDDAQYKKLLERYGTDMDMFGYTHERNAVNGEVTATCVGNNCDT